ncbi:MAG TPA: alpha-glucan family phosphorylase [Candidatus Udaeobacter sp.]|nr:alpha-glucan family phosphorylase [Candidatus Udaeobacter sp.]
MPLEPASRWPGDADLQAEISDLASRVPVQLYPLVELAYNYRWSWTREGSALFQSVDPHRWELCAGNPVRLLEEAPVHSLAAAASDVRFVESVRIAAEELRADLGRPDAPAPFTKASPLAFFCAEFGIHGSLPIYAGGMGVLAGDILKEASDQALPTVGIGLLYRDGYFRQRLDVGGQQHEYWTSNDPERLPAALVTDEHRVPITVTVRLGGRDVRVQVWRVDVGRVPLYLLDTERPDNSRVDRWITARLYVGDRGIRLAQYAVLGIGGMRMLRALGIDPGVVHLNEGHATFAALEQMRAHVAEGRSFEQALGDTREKTVFVTHTPVAAGNEIYPIDSVRSLLGETIAEIDPNADRVLELARTGSRQNEQGFGLTPFAIRTSRSTNAVSKRHGEVSRAMWVQLFGGSPVDTVPIGHVTNGVHTPTWMAPRFRDLFDRHLPRGWLANAADPMTWAAVDAIPDAELWRAMCDQRAELVEYVRDHSVSDRLSRGDSPDRVDEAARTLDSSSLTIVFARRIATYKRLYLMVRDLSRALALLDGPQSLQIVIAGKAHPQDEEAKRLLRDLFQIKQSPNVSGRVVFLDDYDMAMARVLVAGCDVWVNLPRPPNEASGTSGMKVVLNGGLNLSVLDGWWSEAYDGSNGWAISSPETADLGWQDSHDSEALYDLLEKEVRPLFYERDASGVPVRWVARVKRSIRTIAPRFSATRMVDDYLRSSWIAGEPVLSA